MINEQDLITVGRLFKPHGFKGEINADMLYDRDLYTNPKRPFFIKIDNILVPFFVQSVGGGVSGTAFVKLKGIDSDSDASGFFRKELFAEKAEVAKALGISEEELSADVNEIIGFEVIDAESGNVIGTVSDVEEGIEYDYLVIEGEKRIPFVDEFVNEVQENRILVSLPDGLLDL